MSAAASAKIRPRRCRLITLGMLFSAGVANAQTVGSGAAIPPVPTPPVASFIAEAAQKFGIPSTWIVAVMHVESAGYARAQSPKGAMGLMQIMPQTWSSLRARYSLGADPFDPHDNILAGAAYLRELFDRYGAAGFLAAYNAGPSRWEDQLAGRRALPNETVDYVTKLAPMISAGGDELRSEPIVTAYFPPKIASIFVTRLNDPTIPNALPNAGLWPVSRVKIVVSAAPKKRSNALFIALTPRESTP